MRLLSRFLAPALAAAVAAGAQGQTPDEPETHPPMMRGLGGWEARTLLTVGEALDGYRPPGVPDGTAAWRLDDGRVRVLVAHELNADQGYAYSLANGTRLSGARVSYFDIEPGSRRITGAGLAYDRVFDRSGEPVADPVQINESGAGRGFSRFCSAAGYAPGERGFVDRIFFANEEAAKPDHPHGGTVWALDVDDAAIHAAPALGRGAWENVSALDTGNEDQIALLLGDDHADAPLYLWLGTKRPRGGFLARNGLSHGQLHVWVSHGPERTPSDRGGAFSGTGTGRTGSFVPIETRDPARAGLAGHDDQGYLDADSLRASARRLGAFFFSRPEDLHTDPADGRRAVLASTGHGGINPNDQWGTLYAIRVAWRASPSGGIKGADATLRILYDADDPGHREEGIRSPDNLVWAGDGRIYVQEDRATPAFGAGGQEASIWALDPETSQTRRIARMDRAVVVPAGTSDVQAGEVGAWESSGILDVTDLLAQGLGSRALLATVQAHGIRDGVIAEQGLAQGGQLILLEHRAGGEARRPAE